jgi:hypothetical protein
MNTQLSAEEIPDAVRRLVREAIDECGFVDARDINSGSCDQFAKDLVATVGRGKEVWGNMIDPEMPGSDSHCVAAIDGRYYDAEVPEGMDDIRDIPYFSECREIYEESLERMARNQHRRDHEAVSGSAPKDHRRG